MNIYLDNLSLVKVAVNLKKLLEKCRKLVYKQNGLDYDKVTNVESHYPNLYR